jgi:hypothetical protein
MSVVKAELTLAIFEKGVPGRIEKETLELRLSMN